jgi:Polyketide cyclase / dehydrase and lipid transport
MLKKVLRYLFIAIATFMGIGLLLPGKSHVERQIDIAAPSATIYAQINELKNWVNWSPWHKMDPNAKWMYSAPSTAGIGAWYTWEGDKKTVGSGKMTILDADSLKMMHCKMEFQGEADSFADFKLTAKDSTATSIVWTLDTDLGFNPMTRWFGLAMNTFVGPDYEKGLANLKTVCEQEK